MPKISAAKTVKVGVGRYESVDVHASIELDFDRAKTTSDEAFARCFAIVDAQINKQIDELQDIVKPDSVFKVKTTKQRKTT